MKGQFYNLHTFYGIAFFVKIVSVDAGTFPLDVLTQFDYNASYLEIVYIKK